MGKGVRGQAPGQQRAFVASYPRVQTLVSSTPFSVPKVILSPESVQFSIKLCRKSVAELFLGLWGVCYKTRHRLMHSWNQVLQTQTNVLLESGAAERLTARIQWPRAEGHS